MVVLLGELFHLGHALVNALSFGFDRHEGEDEGW